MQIKTQNTMIAKKKVIKDRSEAYFCRKKMCWRSNKMYPRDMLHSYSFWILCSEKMGKCSPPDVLTTYFWGTEFRFNCHWIFIG
jgi:hypothetical protein